MSESVNAMPEAGDGRTVALFLLVITIAAGFVFRYMLFESRGISSLFDMDASMLSVTRFDTSIGAYLIFLEGIDVILNGAVFVAYIAGMALASSLAYLLVRFSGCCRVTLPRLLVIVGGSYAGVMLASFAEAGPGLAGQGLAPAEVLLIALVFASVVAFASFAGYLAAEIRNRNMSTGAV